eukprot:9479361-Pyramimonas_sp.AAC.2
MLLERVHARLDAVGDHPGGPRVDLGGDKGGVAVRLAVREQGQARALQPRNLVRFLKQMGAVGHDAVQRDSALCDNLGDGTHTHTQREGQSPE